MGRRVLVACAGNTCRGPTLMLLLRHKARQLGSVMVVESAGVTSNAEDGRPMLTVAQIAVKNAAAWLDQQGVGSASSADLLEQLASEARQHRSKHIRALEGSAPFDTLVEMVGKQWGKRLQQEPARTLTAGAKLERLELEDTAYETYARRRNEQHPEVIRAYDAQAMTLARLILDRLAYLTIS